MSSKSLFAMMIVIALLAGYVATDFFGTAEATQQTVTFNRNNVWSGTTMGTGTLVCAPPGDPTQEYDPTCEVFALDDQVNSLYTGTLYAKPYIVTDFTVSLQFAKTGSCNSEDKPFNIRCTLVKDDVPIVSVTLSKETPTVTISNTTGWSGAADESLAVVVQSQAFPAGTNCIITNVNITATVNGWDI